MAYDLPIIAPTLPEGFCESLSGPDWAQTLINEGVGRAVAKLDGSGFSVVINQETQPDPSQQTALWYQPSTGLTFSFGGGAWVTPHRSPPGSDERRMWVGTLVGLRSFDGGDGSATTPATNVGAMWEEDTDFQGRSPMGVGAIPTSNPPTNLAVATNAGEGAHTQTANEVGPHTHPLAADTTIQDGDGVACVATGSGGDGLMRGDSGTPLTSITVSNNEYTPAQAAMPIVHPVRGAYVIRRTARINYVGS